MTTAIYWKETKYEFLKRLRVRNFAVFALGFPLMFYILYGLMLPTGRVAGLSTATYLLATYGTFGVMGICLFGFGVALAIERGQGWLDLKQASPMPVAAYFTAKVATCVVFSVVLVILLLSLGLGFGHVQLSPLALAGLAGTLILGAIPFAAFGLLLGYLANANSAPSFINMIYLPLSFCSGLWMPIQMLPNSLQHVAHFLPPYHLSQLALYVIGASDSGDYWLHWEALGGFTLLFLGLARLAYGRDESHKNGVA
jgi:ABC-2 type transport system permease protein